jgi:hypothetical protein
MNSLNFANPLVTISHGNKANNNGKQFEKDILNWFRNSYPEYTFEQGCRLYIGNPQKCHNFDIVGIENNRHSTMVIESRDYNWIKNKNNTNEIPNEKISALNETALFLSLSTCSKKFIIMRKTNPNKNGETLAQYYYRIYGHILNSLQIKLAEFDTVRKEFREI